MTSANKLQFGAIVWAEVNEPDGVTPAGEHPAVVLNKQNEIDAGHDVDVVVCSTSFHYPLPSGWFDIPSRPGGDPQTGLPEACVVKATWPAIVRQSTIRTISGRAPIAVCRQILNWIKAKQAEKAVRTNGNPS